MKDESHFVDAELVDKIHYSNRYNDDIYEYR